jgi:hypothetical protein
MQVNRVGVGDFELKCDKLYDICGFYYKIDCFNHEISRILFVNRVCPLFKSDSMNLVALFYGRTEF